MSGRALVSPTFRSLSRTPLVPFPPLRSTFSTFSSSNPFATQGYHFEILTPHAIARLREKDSELARSKQSLKQAVADNERLRVRALTVKAQAKEQAMKRLAKDVLDVKDDLELALRGARMYIESLSGEGLREGLREGGEEGRRRREEVLLESLYQGVELSHKALLSTLSRYGIEKMEPLGRKFDPDLHQGLQELEDASKAPGTVAAVLKDGYMLEGSVLRTAQVSTFREPTV